MNLSILTRTRPTSRRTGGSPVAKAGRWKRLGGDGLTAMAAGLAVAGAVAFSGARQIEGKGGDRQAAAAADRQSPGRSGDTATEPVDLPAGGWWQIVKRTYGEIGRDRVPAVAAGVTFYGLLAFFPALVAFVSLYGLVADPLTIVEHLASLESIVPTEALNLIRDQMTRIVGSGRDALGLALAISVGLSLWSANSGMKAVFDALNVAYGESEKRSFIVLNLVSLTFTAGVLLFVVAAITSLAVVPVVLSYLYLGATTEMVLTFGRWPLLFAVLIIGLAVLYRFGPSRTNARWSWVTPGAVFAAVSWIAASALFSWYVANFADYNRTYGTFGALIGLLMWMWLSASIVLIGAELNSESERQTLRDTTEAPAKPIGLRGADAADNKS